MSATPARLSDPATVAVLHRLYELMDDACRRASDLDLPGAAVLADVTARSQGLSLRKLREDYGFCAEAAEGTAPFVRPLAERELAALGRSAEDRRALALCATAKGAERSALIDRALGARMVETFPGLTEESFDQLVELGYGYARAVGHPAAAAGLFPAPVLRQLVAFWHRVVLIAARFGMTSLQVVVLGRVCVSRPGLSAGTRAEDLGLSERFLDVQMEGLRDRGLVLEGDVLGCTEAGFQRITDFTQRLAAAQAEKWEALSVPERTALGKLLQYVLYLFS
ncbi:hypothetical protein PZH32_08055 [Adlercreutzia equolifaciens]|uniref:hypothetical protein n=1 Tax=Adlercreutzia equolifaciens TaxID=446660 RepID=UPI0023AF4541|nr:hypothetical protein [Adlercreutzia equolifaciens]MDE8702918.1 hypothetical protein [Adlercreutzia equolifaciens]